MSDRRKKDPDFIPPDIQEIFALTRIYAAETEKDADAIARQFASTKNRAVVTVGELDCPSGRIAVGDPITYMPMGKYCPTLDERLPAGRYPVEALVYRSATFGIRLCAVRVKLTRSRAVRYRLARSAEGTAVGQLPDGEDMTGFPVDGGLVGFVDSMGLETFADFIAKWHKNNPGKNHYDDYFAPLFAHSAQVAPEHQRELGDFIEWTNPMDSLSMVMAASGFGDGFYQCFWGDDTSGEVCELLIPLIDPELLEETDSTYRRMERLLPDSRGCLVTLRILQEGKPVGYLYREQPSAMVPDSGWRLFSGDEDRKYLESPDNIRVVDLAVICKGNPKLLPVLNAPVGSKFYRTASGDYIPDDRKEF